MQALVLVVQPTSEPLIPLLPLYLVDRRACTLHKVCLRKCMPPGAAGGSVLRSLSVVDTAPGPDQASGEGPLRSLWVCKL